MHQLETLLESNVDKNFDKLEIYVLRNVLHVDEALVPWVRLGHYEVCSCAIERRVKVRWIANAAGRISRFRIRIRRFLYRPLNLYNNFGAKFRRQGNCMRHFKRL